MDTMKKNNRAQLLLERINSEFNLTSLSEQVKGVLDNASIISVLEEVADQSSEYYKDIILEAVNKIKALK